MVGIKIRPEDKNVVYGRNEIFLSEKLHPKTHHICYLDEKTEEMRRDFRIYLLVQEKQHE